MRVETAGKAGGALPGPASGRLEPAAAHWRLEAATNERRAEACEAVIDIVSALFNVSGRDLRGPGRNAQETARVRQIAMYLCNTTLGVKLTAVGRVFGRDRTTVGHGVQLIEALRDDREFDLIIEQCERVVSAAFAFGEGEDE
jgi:chromosomal replication initiation ATPase DnaA